MSKIIYILLIFTTIPAWGSATRILDAQQITNGSAVLTLPSVTTTVVGTSTSDTLTNKTLDFSSNTASNIPTSSISGSALSGTNTGDVTIGTANGLSLVGQALSLQLSTSGQTGALSSTDWSTFNGKQAAGNYITALTGDVTAAGPGSSAATLATVNSNVGSFTNANITVNAKGLITAASNGSGAFPTNTGSRGSPSLITAAGGIVFTGSDPINDWYIAGDSGAVTVTANPQIAVGSTDGQRLTLTGRHATNTVTLSDGTGLSLNGTWVGGLDSILNLRWDGTNWVEMSRR